MERKSGRMVRFAEDVKKVRSEVKRSVSIGLTQT